jgi:hypothetical protein
MTRHRSGKLMSAKLTIEVQGVMKGKDINKEFKAEYRFSIEK